MPGEPERRGTLIRYPRPMDIFDRLDEAARATAEVARGVKPDQLSAATPCKEWNVQQLMDHMAGSYSHFVVRAEGKEAGPPQPVAAGTNEETVERVATNAQAAASAWRSHPESLERKIQTPIGEMAGQFVAGMTLTELLTHGWDLARATGQRFGVDQAVAEELLNGIRGNIPPQARQTAFGPEVAAPPDAPATDRLAAYLGRQP